MHEPLSNDEIIARLDVVLRKLDELKTLVKQVQADASEE